MIAATFTLCAALATLAAMQAFYVWKFVRRFEAPAAPLLPDQDCPPAHAVLCIRGKDPFLADCLDALCRQDYPKYQVHIVVDHADDPALPIVEQQCRSFEHVSIHVLKKPLQTCSLKCSSLVQVISEIDLSGDAIIGLLDSDTIPTKNWLRSISSSLHETNVGVVSGVRWYEPQTGNLGTAVRYVWNAAAIVQMVIYRIAWGGTLGLNGQTIQKCRLLDHWSTALCEDTMLRAKLSESDLETAYRPELFIVNRESCRLSDLYPWLTRQLLTARLYHPSWFLVVAHAICTTLVMATAPIVGLVAVATHFHCFVLLSMASLFYQIANVWLLAEIGKAVQSHLPTDSKAEPWPFFSLWLSSVIAQLLYCRCVIAAMFLKAVQWRGVEYRIAGPWDIQLVKYEPYQQAAADEQNSL